MKLPQGFPALTALLLACSLRAGADPAPAGPRVWTHLSDAYTVDKVYRSMNGPQSLQPVHIEDGPSHLVWITGYKTEIVGEDGEEKVSQDFMCHSNLDVPDVTAHMNQFRTNNLMNPRLFTLSQGILDVKLPEGFGIPMMSDETLNLNTQVLNLNPKTPVPFTVRHKVTIQYYRDADLPKPLQPLMTYSAFGMAALDKDHAVYGEATPDEKQKALSCLASTPASANLYNDFCGNTFTGHWVVKPGREVNHTLCSKLMALPYDTTVQYIAVHLHPYAESLELRDVTTNSTIFKSNARNYPDRIGLDHVDCYSNPNGITLYRNHQYELVSIYNNTTEDNQDSMAVMYLYLLDKDFKRPLTTPPPTSDSNH